MHCYAGPLLRFEFGDPCEVILTSLISQYTIHELFYVLDKLSESVYYDMSDFGLFRVQPRVSERACILIKEGYLISISCAYSLKID